MKWTITRACNTCEHYPNDKHCIGCELDSKGENTKWELKENPIVIERKVLDKIRAEIMSLTDGDTPERIWNVDVLEIIDKYRKEQEDWHGKRSSDEKAYKDFCKGYFQKTYGKP